jgi:hypothetical protein
MRVPAEEPPNQGPTKAPGDVRDQQGADGGHAASEAATAAALATMLDRVAGSERATRDVLLQGTLVVRHSCGSRPPP